MKAKSSGRSHPRSGFTPEEDCLLVDLVAQFGDDNWSTIASYMEKRNARQCKDRYMSYLSPTINNGPYSEEEDCLLRQKYQELGPKWVKISKFFPNRTDISVKCRWAVLNRRDLKNKEKRRADSQTPSQSVKSINPKENTRYNTTNNNNNINRDNIIYNTRSKSWNCKNVNQNFYFNGSSYSNNSSCTNNLNNSKSKNSVYVFDSDYESDSYYDNDNENSFEEIQKEAIQQNNNTQGMESNSSIYFNHQNIQMNEIQNQNQQLQKYNLNTIQNYEKFIQKKGGFQNGIEKSEMKKIEAEGDKIEKMKDEAKKNDADPSVDPLDWDFYWDMTIGDIKPNQPIEWLFQSSFE